MTRGFTARKTCIFSRNQNRGTCSRATGAYNTYCGIKTFWEILRNKFSQKKKNSQKQIFFCNKLLDVREQIFCWVILGVVSTG